MSASLRVLVVTRDQSELVQSMARNLCERLREFDHVSVVAVVVPDELDNSLEFDLVIALGGDGTILRTCRQMGRNQRPVIGVNMGHLGFLADLSPADLLDRLSAIAYRNFRTISHLMYECRLLRGDGTTENHLGLNEVAILSAGALQLLQIELSIDNEMVATFAGDGLLVSTPIGSTAHSLAAGGPILKQDLQAFVITPICPHTLMGRPLVDHADCVYRMQARNAQPGVTLSIDGQIKLELSADDIVEVRRADVAFQLARLAQHSFYSSLHRKLGWSGHPHYGA